MKQADITNDKTRSLFDLGKVADGGPWIDYLQYGFDESDVPALLELVADDSLNNADTGSKAVWVPLHAWRALGQIGSDKAVAPLLGLFDSMQQDDWAFQELPGVIGMIGKSAVIPLCDYLSAAEHDEQARVMAVDALNEIVAHDPACRAVVIRCCQEYLSHPDESAGFLNGMVVACLLDMDAREAIDDIRRLFQKGCVDIAVAGDLEDVEIELGLRARRSTPRPGLFSLFDPDDPAELQGPEPGDTLSDPDDPAELQEPDPGDTFDVIEFNLLRYGNEDSIRDISELDGFFAALGCAPQTIMPSRWMPAIWGGGEQAPKWETEDDAQMFYSAVLALYNSIMHALVEQDFAPLFDEVGAADGAVSSAATWCAGFLRGLDLWVDEAPDDRAFIEARIEPIRLVASEACAEQPAGRSKGAILAEYGEITSSVTRLFEHYFARRVPGSQTLVRNQPKVGRNDPCPCGSGKKFKKCCLH